MIPVLLPCICFKWQKEQEEQNGDGRYDCVIMCMFATSLGDNLTHTNPSSLSFSGSFLVAPSLLDFFPNKYN